MSRLSLILLLAMATSPVVAATYKVGLNEAGYEPFSFPAGDKRPGIFFAVLNAIGKKTGDVFEPVYAPTVRIKALFEQGKVDIECGVNPAWRDDQAAISVYSRSFATIDDVLLYRQNAKPAQSPLKTVKIGAKLKVGTVRGYRYPKIEPFFTAGSWAREDADNEQQLLQMLQRGRVDFLAIGLLLARYFMQLNPGHGFAIGEVIGSVPVSFRVHKSKEDLLKRLDPVLERLRKSGELDRMVHESPPAKELPQHD